MWTQRSLKCSTVVIGLTALVVVFLVGQMSAPSSASAQGQSCVAVAATHTGQWKGDQTIWKAGRPAVVTITISPGSPHGAYLTSNVQQNIFVLPGSGATNLGTEIIVDADSSAVSGTYMITTTVPCP